MTESEKDNGDATLEQQVADITSASEDHEPAAAPRPIDAPMDAFVKGGTTTWESDKQVEREFQEAERRRDAADAERRLAQTPIDAGGAQLYTHKLTDSPEVPKAYILLTYLNAWGGDTGHRCLADLIIGVDEDPNELTLIIVCPRCVAGQLHHGQAQMQIRQSNRMFHFVAGAGPRMVRFEDEVYYSAGMIMESEKFTCPRCSWSARIERNFVREEG